MPFVICILVLFPFSLVFAQTSGDQGNISQKAQQLESELNSQSKQSLAIPSWIKTNAKYWSDGSISDSEFVKGIQYLIDVNILHVSNQQTPYNSLNQELEVIKQQIISQSKPATIISSGQVHWYFSDSSGKKYDWSIPISVYDAEVKLSIYQKIPMYDLKLPNGKTISTYDYRDFAQYISSKKEFRQVVDELYDNSISDYQFIFEVWHMTSELSTYSKDITNNNLWPYEVLTRGEGDCKDKAILIADLLRSSSHTSNWDIHLVLMDIDNPTNPQTVNHMIVSVNTGNQHGTILIEATAPPDDNGLNMWTGKQITGWNIPF